MGVRRRTSEVPLSVTGAAAFGVLLLASPALASMWGWAIDALDALQFGAIAGVMVVRAAKWLRARRRSHICFRVLA